MANEIGHAFIALVPSFKGAASTIKRELASAGVGSAIERELTSSATRSGTRAGGLFSRAFNRGRGNINFPGPSASVLRNIRTYAFALTGIGSLTVGLGLKTAASIEQAKAAFATLLGSADRARSLFQRLQKFNLNTPFDLPGIVSASQKLLAFGFSAKKLIPTLTAIGDAAAGLGGGSEAIDRITVALGQMVAKGRVQSDELLQLTEANVPALKILANAFGVSTAAMQAMVTKGLVPANKAVPALLRGLETGTKGLGGTTRSFAGLMAKESHTLGGIFSNLKDTVSVGLARAVRPLIPVLKRDIPRAMKALPGLFRAAARDLGEFLHGLGVAKDRSKGVSTGFEQFGGVLRGTFNAVKGTFGFISRNAKVFKPLAAAIFGAVAAATAFRLAMAAVNLISTGGIIGAIGAVIGVLIYAYKKSETFRDIVKGVFHALERAVGQWVSINVRGFKFVLDVFLGFVGTLIHGAASAFGWVPKVGPKLKGAAKAFDGFKAHVDSTFSSIADRAAGWGAETGYNWASGFVSATRKQQFAAAAKFFVKGSGLGNLGKALGQDSKKAGGNAGTLFTGGLGDGIDKGGDKVSKSMSSLVDKILGPLKDLLSKAKQLAQSVTQSILGETGFGALLSQTDAFGQTSFGTSVKSIISGFLNQRREVRRFRRELRLLDKRGLSAGAIADIANLGLAQGGQVAEGLLAGTRKQLRRVSRLRRQTNLAGQGIGTDVAGARFGAQITHELVKTQREIKKAREGTELGDKTIRKLKGGFARQEKAAKVYLDTGQLDRHDGRIVASLV